jgi:hypothetical protein
MTCVLFEKGPRALVLVEWKQALLVPQSDIGQFSRISEKNMWNRPSSSAKTTDPPQLELVGISFIPEAPTWSGRRLRRPQEGPLHPASHSQTPPVGEHTPFKLQSSSLEQVEEIGVTSRRSRRAKRSICYGIK